jgi:GNAT superfamily N-acetyltransferase
MEPHDGAPRRGATGNADRPRADATDTAAATEITEAAATGSLGAATTTGSRGAAAITGSSGATAATGSLGATATTGSSGAAATTGSRGPAATTGSPGATATTGFRGPAAITGSPGAAATRGSLGAADTTGGAKASGTTGPAASGAHGAGHPGSPGASATPVRSGRPGDPGPPLVRVQVEPPVWTYGELRLRRYRPADHGTVLALHREGLAQVGLRPGDGVYYDHDFFRMEEIYLRKDGEFLVGELRGEIVAMGGLRRADLVPAGGGQELGGYVLGGPALDTVEMVRLRVRPGVQRRGYGSAVIRALERRAAELGYRVLRADTTERQQPALRLYRRFGWTELRRAPIGGTVNVYLEKTLQ